METKKIEIEVPEGKTAKWIDGVLKLVDEEIRDTRPVTERIKTFEDACNELGETHPLVLQYNTLCDCGANGVGCTDVAAYLKLRIICAALNEGWKPQFTKDEYRYYPWFRFYSKEEIDNMDEDKCKKLVLCGSGAGVDCGFAFADSYADMTNAYAYVGSHLCLKSSELSTYCGKQFIDIWADFVLIRR